MRGTRLAAVVSILLAPAFACSSFDAAPGPIADAGEDAGPEAAPLPDAAAPADGTAIESGTGGELVSEDLEAVDACSHWDLQGATFTRVPGGHGGGFACSLCSTVAVDVYFGISRALTPVAGSTYYAEAWIEGAKAPPAAVAFVQLESPLSDGGTSVAAASNPVPATWQSFKTPVAQAPSRLFIGAQTKAVGECFLVDDIAVRKP